MFIHWSASEHPKNWAYQPYQTNHSWQKGFCCRCYAQLQPSASEFIQRTTRIWWILCKNAENITILLQQNKWFTVQTYWQSFSCSNTKNSDRWSTLSFAHPFWSSNQTFFYEVIQTTVLLPPITAKSNWYYWIMHNMCKSSFSSKLQVCNRTREIIHAHKTERIYLSWYYTPTPFNRIQKYSYFASNGSIFKIYHSILYER